MKGHEPLIYLHADGEYVSIRFSDQTTGDTLLRVGGQHGPAGWRDKEIVAEWVAAVEGALERDAAAREFRPYPKGGKR